MPTNNKIDADLVKNGDSRNVVDAYKTWKVPAIKSDMGKRAFPLHVAIENFQHDYNIGSIVRTANACNVSGVHIIGKRHWNRRGAMATEKYLSLFHHPSIEDFLKWQNKSGLLLIGVDNIKGSLPLNEARLPQAAIYVFGQEGPGLSKQMQQHCEYLIGIEQFGSTRSVNVGVAAGIILYEWLRRNALSKSAESKS